MTKKDEGKTVERSRLVLLGGLAAGAAGGGCQTHGDKVRTTSKPGKGYKTFGSQSYPAQDQGGEGGGGGH